RGQDPPQRVQPAADLYDEHHPLPRHRARVELFQRILDRALHDPGIPDRNRFGFRLCGHQNTCPCVIMKCSTMGPRLSARKNVSAPTMTMTPTSRPEKSGVVTGNVPSDG